MDSINVVFPSLHSLQGDRQTSRPWLNCICSLRETSLGSMLLQSKGWCFFLLENYCRRSYEQCLSNSLAQKPVQVSKGTWQALTSVTRLRTHQHPPLSIPLYFSVRLSPSEWVFFSPSFLLLTHSCLVPHLPQIAVIWASGIFIEWFCIPSLMT